MKYVMGMDNSVLSVASGQLEKRPDQTSLELCHLPFSTWRYVPGVLLISAEAICI